MLNKRTHYLTKVVDKSNEDAQNVKKYFAASLTNNSFNTLTFNAKDKTEKNGPPKGTLKIEPTLTKYRNKLKSA